jgi:hypothetical protein
MTASAPETPPAMLEAAGHEQDGFCRTADRPPPVAIQACLRGALPQLRAASSRIVARVRRTPRQSP